MRWGEGFKIKDWSDLYLILRIILVLIVIILLLSRVFNFTFLINLFNLMFNTR